MLPRGRPVLQLVVATLAIVIPHSVGGQQQPQRERMGGTWSYPDAAQANAHCGRANAATDKACSEFKGDACVFERCDVIEDHVARVICTCTPWPEPSGSSSGCGACRDFQESIQMGEVHRPSSSGTMSELVVE